MRLIVAVCLALASLCAHAVDLNLVAIMGDKAMVEVDGSRPKLLAPGQSAGGAKLLSVSNGVATFDVGGQRKSLSMDNRSYRNTDGDGKAHGGNKTMIVPIDASGHFFVQLTVNGTPVRGLIDTGATTMAISSNLAKQANIDTRYGETGYAQTAQGVVPFRKVKIDVLRFGDMLLYNVEATVLEGRFPVEPLIGMNILQRFTMQREADRLTLIQRY